MVKKPLIKEVRNLKACIELMLLFSVISVGIAHMSATMSPDKYRQFKSLMPFMHPSPTLFCIYMLLWSVICYWFVQRIFKTLHNEEKKELQSFSESTAPQK